MNVSEPVIIATIAAVPGTLAAYFGYRQSVKAGERRARTAALSVEAGAYERAKQFYEAGIQQLENQVGRLQVQLENEQNASDELRKQIRKLRAIIAELRTQLKGAGIVLPPSEVEDELPIE